MKKTGIIDLHFHDLRHTFATRIQNQDVPFPVIQHLLGHKIKGATADYCHGGKGWNLRLRKAVTSLELTCKLTDKISVNYPHHGSEAFQDSKVLE